jgi:hypothetical protein
MSKITDPANTYDFGQGFNYAVWTPNTVVTMCNVPWNNDYRDIVEFPTDTGQTLDQYIDNAELVGIHIPQMSYLKPNNPIRIEIPFNKAIRFNYLRAKNPVQPIPGSDVPQNFYYFVTDVRYLTPGTTEVVLQLDVWTTYGGYGTFGRCYIERGHIGIANTNAFNNYGRDYLTVPEGLDVGSEMQIIKTHNEPIMSQGLPSDTDTYNILVVSTIDLSADPGSVAAPQLRTATGGMFAGMPSGATQYLWPTISSFETWLTSMSGSPWVTQGIISITIIPPISRYGIIGWADGNAPTPVPSYVWLPRSYAMLTDWRANTDILNYIPERYQGLKKLFTSPYMMIELTTFTGTPVLLKPESWNNPDAMLIEHISPTQPGQRLGISPYKYNALNQYSDGDSQYVGDPSASFPALGDDKGEYLDLATYISNFPTLAIVNNGAISYLAANANGIAFQYQSADWSQQRALGSNQTSYDQASSAMNLANQLTGIGVNQDVASTNIANSLTQNRALLGIAGDVAGGLAGGNGNALPIVGGVGGIASGITRGMGAMMDIDASTKQQAVRQGAALGGNSAQQQNMGYMRDTNKGLADWSARGDYANQIAGINAKVRDAQLIQPTTSGQVGGDAFNFINNNVMVSARWKMIDHAAMSVVCEYWLRYGYSVRRFAMMGQLKVMSKFTYWKLTETYFQSATMPESFKQIIRGIFEKGVTVWSNPDYIGVTDTADNAPIGGITL